MYFGKKSIPNLINFLF